MERALLMARDARGEGSEDSSWNVPKHLDFLPQDEVQCPFDSLLCYLEAEILFDKLILGVSILKKRVKRCGRCVFGVPLRRNSFDNCCFKKLTSHPSDVLILEKNAKQGKGIFFKVKFIFPLPKDESSTLLKF